MPSPKNLYLYLHTHWDREWYLTHEEYRTQLSFVAVDILNKLKTGSIPSFLLDGQACVIEDIEEVVPALCDEIREQIAQKKLEVGPWYVLADQMLVSGESLLRNLEMGLAVTSRFGKPAILGYCPDTFGHSQDLPRIFNHFDIKTAFVWRGVPARTQGPLFWWQSPDGSRVLSYHLARGYFQTAFHDSLTTEKLAEFFLSWGAHDVVFDSVLVPVGGDHLSAPNNFNRQLDAARLLLKIESMGLKESTSKGTIAVQSCTLSQFSSLMLEHAAKNSADVMTSELRDNAAAFAHERAYMLSGVLSTRLYLKLRNRKAERRLARIAEPLFTLLDAQKVFQYPQAQLNYAWRILLRNQPHDSICGCSIDAVHREMLTRFDDLGAVLNVLDRKVFEAMAIDKESDVEHLFDALASHAKATPKPEVAGKNANSVCNVGYKLNDDEQNADEEQIDVLSVLRENPFPHPDFSASRLLIANLSGEQNIGPVPISWCEELDSSSSNIDVFCPNKAVTVQVVASRQENCLFSGSNQLPETKSVRVYDGFVHAQSLPTFGLSVMPWNTGSGYGVTDEFCQFAPDSSDAGCSENVVFNEFFKVEIGTGGDITVVNKKVNGVTNKLGHYIRDVGDNGDTYNFDPIVADQPLGAQLIGVARGKKGPLVASLILTYRINIPEGCSDRARSNEVIEHILKTEILLKKSVPILFFETSWKNESRNHRLEVVFDTGATVARTFSENHFSIVERLHVAALDGLDAPVAAGCEAPLNRFPCQRFFIANGQVFFNNGLPEYAVDSSNVCITLLRAVSDLSRSDLRSRGGGAGPQVSTDEANCLGLQKVEYAWAPIQSSSYGQQRLSKPVFDDAVNPEAQTVLKHLAESAIGSVVHESAEYSFKSMPAQSALSVAQDELVNAYRLCEIFEGLNWSCFTRDVPILSKNHVALDNPGIRVVAMRMLEKSSEIEIRLLNVLATAQKTEITVHFAHHDAHLTFADGRLIMPLVAKEENQHIIKGEAKKKVNDLAYVATYLVEMEANALISLRLK